MILTVRRLWSGRRVSLRAAFGSLLSSNQGELLGRQLPQVRVRTALVVGAMLDCGSRGDQAARVDGRSVTSVASRKVTPATTFGNWFSRRPQSSVAPPRPAYPSLPASAQRRSDVRRTCSSSRSRSSQRGLTKPDNSHSGRRRETGGRRPSAPSPATSTASATPSGATRRPTSPAPPNSKVLAGH